MEQSTDLVDYTAVEIVMIEPNRPDSRWMEIVCEEAIDVQIKAFCDERAALAYIRNSSGISCIVIATRPRILSADEVIIRLRCTNGCAQTPIIMAKGLHTDRYLLGPLANSMPSFIKPIDADQVRQLLLWVRNGFAKVRPSLLPGVSMEVVGGVGSKMAIGSRYRNQLAERCSD